MADEEVRARPHLPRCLWRASDNEPSVPKPPPKSVVEEHARLCSGELAGLAVGLLHGQLASKEKEATMAAFRRGEIQVLVATTVIEVGVDVANATVMVIEDADRFGIAQLHQLRGRVGRGRDKSWCYLLAEVVTPGAARRLRALEATQRRLRAGRGRPRAAGRGHGATGPGKKAGATCAWRRCAGTRSWSGRPGAVAEEIVDEDPTLEAHPCSPTRSTCSWTRSPRSSSLRAERWSITCDPERALWPL